MAPSCLRLTPGLLAALSLVPGCVEEDADPISGNLLVGARSENSGVPNIFRLADGQLAVEGDHWDTGITARFEHASGMVTWDLGSSQPVRCTLLQGDNNDVYILSGSPDGKTWQTLHEFAPVEGAGMRTRQGQVDGQARYLRLTARGGDQLFSVSELAVWSECPKDWPKLDLVRAEGAPTGGGGEPVSSWKVSLGVLVAAAAVLILLSRKRRPAPLGEDEPADPAR
jgi:hypothetical protein